MEASALRAPAGLTRIALPTALLRLRSDEQLVALFRAGSDEAFNVIHDRYKARLFAYTRQMLGGSRTDAEDALQDVFLRAYNALRMDERPVMLKAWLYRVAHNRCIDQIRRPVPAPDALFDVSRTPMPDPLAEAERRDDLRRLVADMQELPEQQRSALLMREMEGLSYADLAQALDTTVPAVKSLLVRARIGLVEAAEARNTACVEIRDDLTLSFGKGVRASAKARRHMKDCRACSDFRRDLRAVQTGIQALTPGGHPLGLVAKLLGIGGAGGGAAAGAAGGGTAVVAGGGVVAGTTAKVAAVVCCAAITAGGAVELKDKVVERVAPPSSAERARDASSSSGAGAAAKGAAGPEGATVLRHQRTAPHPATDRVPAAPAPAKSAAAAGPAAAAPLVALPEAEEAISPHIEEPAVATGETGEVPTTGGALAPDEAPAEPTSGTAEPGAAPEGQTASADPSAGTANGAGSTSAGTGTATASSGSAAAPTATSASTATTPGTTTPAGTTPPAG